MSNYPDTPAQQWAEEHEACAEGRDELGAQTLVEWWQTSQQADYMLWVARKADALSPAETSVQIALECAEMVEHKMPPASKECLVLVREWLANPNSVSNKEIKEVPVAVWAVCAVRAAEEAVWAVRAARAAWGAEGAAMCAEQAARYALCAGADPEALTAIVRKHIPECPIDL